MSVFVGYSISDSGHAVPVSVAPVREEAFSQAVHRVLSLGIIDGEIGVQEKPLSDADAEDLRGTLNKWFAERGIR